MPNRNEVQQALWIPLATLRRAEARGVMSRDYGGLEIEHPTIRYEGHTIWGLTHRILTRFVEVVS